MIALYFFSFFLKNKIEIIFNIINLHGVRSEISAILWVWHVSVAIGFVVFLIVEADKLLTRRWRSS
ncbi:MAG: hypothetical protein ACR5LC_05670 [Symbiopectobacterium sp.]|uniref:hypothetical protein n=1 Tax=Symbiopectobacterium sp. TaxID=2952789 RepID=UPI003F3518F5